jgi:hypothetical protein
MNTKLADDKDSPRIFARYGSLLATFIAASAIALAQPVLARGPDDSALSFSTNEMGSGDVAPPSFEEPWNDESSSFAGPALAPAPEQPDAAAPGGTFEGFPSEPSAGPWAERPQSQFAQPWVNPSISATNQMGQQPAMGLTPGVFGRPAR